MSNIGKGLNEAYGRYDRRDAYQRDYDASVAGMGKRDSYAYQMDGGANDEGWDEPQRDYYKKPAAPAKKGYYFYNVPAGQDAKAQEVGLFRTKSGKWYSPFPNTRADMFFGAGKFWAPKNESAQLDELSNDTLANYKKKAGADATAADKAGDYKRGDKRMSGIIKATKKEFDNDAKDVNEEQNPHTSAIGKALFRDLSKEKKASPAQVKRNEIRWARRQKAKAEQPPTKGMSNAEKVDKGWRNPNIDEGIEQVYKVIALDKSNALGGKEEMTVKADSIEDLFSRLSANDWYPLEINGVEVIAGKRLKQGVAEDDAGDVEQRMLGKIEKEKQRLAKLKQTDPEAYKREMDKSEQSRNRMPAVSTFEQQDVSEGPAFDKWANERAASQLHKLIAPEIKGKIQNIVSRLSDEYGMWDHKAQTFTPDGLEHLKSILKFNDRYIKYALSLNNRDFEAEGVAEELNPEYDDEAGMADNNLETLERAIQGIDEIIQPGDNLPEWCQEKIAVAKSMLVAVWDYMKSEESDSLEEDWQKVNKSDKTDGMSKKAVKAYRRENPGSKLKTAVTTKPSKLKKGSKSAKRRKSFCARMSGMKKAHASAKTKRDPDSPINKALRRWNCESVEQMQKLVMIAEQKVNEAKNAKQQAAIAIAKKQAKK